MAEAAPTSNIPQLTPELKEKAQRELNETDENRLPAIAELRLRFKEVYPTLTLPREDDAFLLRFLRTKKFRMPDALKLLHNYVKFRVDHPEMFKEPTRAEFDDVMANKAQGILPGRDIHGCAVLVMIVSRMAEDKVNFMLQMRAGAWMMEILMEDPANQINGIVIIEDLSNFSLSLMSKMRAQDPDGLAMKWMQECFPCRMKGIHAIHQPWYLSVLMAFVRPFMSKKLQERVCIYGSDFEKLHKRFPKEILPKEFGGEYDYDDHMAVFRPFIEQLPA